MKFSANQPYSDPEKAARKLLEIANDVEVVHDGRIYIELINGPVLKGRKRHILVDTLGLLLNVVVHPADIQDRDGAFHLLRRARRLFPFIERIFADGGYAGRKMAMTVWRTGAWRLQIVKRSDAAGFEALPKRWIVERTFAWISRNRRLARDFERYATTVAAFIRLAMIRVMLRRLAANASP